MQLLLPLLLINLELLRCLPLAQAGGRRLHGALLLQAQLERFLLLLPLQLVLLQRPSASIVGSPRGAARRQNQ
jgi:hypothetical protein